MKKIISILTFFVLSLSYYSTSAYFYSDYYWESINNFINSHSKSDLVNIEKIRIKNCEKVYLIATRRRDYTDIEKLVCSDIFTIKRQEEIDYITYMFRNRGIY